MRHYRRFLLLLVLLLETTFGLVGYAQQVMLADSITKNPVCYATVYDANGTVIGRSDMGGCINLQKGFEYHISHISYESKSLVYNEDSIIFLSPSFYTISEVSVTAKKRKYYHCKVFFRSIEHVDSCLKYYMDGIREFFIDTKRMQKGALRKCRNELLHVKEKRHCAEETEHDDWRQVHGSSVS